MEKRYSKTPIELVTREEPEQDNNSIGTLTGYIAVFNSDSVNMSGYVEQIAPSAFEDSLKDNDVVALINHDHSVVVGRMSAGTLRLKEDDHGLYFEIDLPDTQAGRDLKVNVGLKNLIGCSFGFCIEAEEWDDKEEVCTLTRVNLFEVSVGVTFPAYPSSSMELRLANHRNKTRDRDKAKYRLRVIDNVVRGL